LQVPPKRVQALIEYGFVQARLGADVAPGCLTYPRRRPGYVSDLKIFNTHNRVVLADDYYKFVKSWDELSVKYKVSMLACH